MKIKRLGILLLMLCFIFSSLGIQVYAAIVGEELQQPESGWKRYDDTNTLFVKEGTWNNTTNSSSYNGGHIYTTDSTSKIKFRFYGTKLRYISYVSTTSGSGDFRILIDDVDVSGVLSNSASLDFQILLYEITDLPLGIHNVVIESLNTGCGFDAIDIDDTGELIDSSTSIPQSPSNLVATAGDLKVELSWDTVDNVDSYNIYRSTKSGGSYTAIAEGITETSYTDTNVENGTTYYYVVTAVNSDVESDYSNEVTASPEAPSTDNALLKITMANGMVNEYDLSMIDIDDFIDWYDDMANGNGKAYYTIDKNYNIGPFISRKDYIIFDKILQFEVMEYNK